MSLTRCRYANIDNGLFLLLSYLVVKSIIVHLQRDENQKLNIFSKILTIGMPTTRTTPVTTLQF